jgi:hypothetical protein
MHQSLACVSSTCVDAREGVAKTVVRRNPIKPYNPLAARAMS